VILSLLNHQLYDDLSRSELFITMFYARYNAATGRLSYANAGHNRPMVFRPGETSCQELDAEGLILGVKQEVVFEEQAILLRSGDLIFFHTDGIPEAASPAGELYGTERICKHLSTIGNLSAGQIADSFYEQARQFSGEQNLQDDISMVVLKILT